MKKANRCEKLQLVRTCQQRSNGKQMREIASFRNKKKKKKKQTTNDPRNVSGLKKKKWNWRWEMKSQVALSN